MKRFPWIALLVPLALVAVVIAALPAQPSQAQFEYLLNYRQLVPIVAQVPPTPTPEPTAAPTATPRPVPELGTLGLQYADVGSTKYGIDAVQLISNEDAAATYPDKNAALRAFQAQGREQSYFIRFIADSFSTSPLGISDQVTRYITSQGAADGQEYVLQANMRDGYSEVFARQQYGESTRVLFRTLKDGNTTFAQYIFSIRVGRYHTNISAIDVNGFLPYSLAESYAVKAFGRLRDGSAGGAALIASDRSGVALPSGALPVW